MLKNTHIKTIITFSILGIIIITAMGVYQIHNLSEISNLETFNVDKKITEIIRVTVIANIIYAVFCLIMGIVMSRIINKPITKLLEDADKVISNNKKDKKNKNNDEIIDTFNMMTNELRENLSEMSRQKKQIETIILHMTDGIIAFDMEGKVIEMSRSGLTVEEIAEELGMDEITVSEILEEAGEL